MVRILILIVLLVGTSCVFENDTSDKVFKLNTSNTIRYYNSSLLKQASDFVKINHQGSKCVNELSKEVYNLYLFLDEVYNQLLEGSGGYDKNGELLFASREKIAASVIRKVYFKEQLSTLIEKIGEISKKENIPYGKMIFEKINDDIGVFEYKIYEDKNIDNLTLLQFYNDLIMVKSSLLFSEIMYFEMLKSTGP